MRINHHPQSSLSIFADLQNHDFFMRDHKVMTKRLLRHKDELDLGD